MAEPGKFVGRSWRPPDDSEPGDAGFRVLLTLPGRPDQPTLCLQLASDPLDDEWESLTEAPPMQGRAENSPQHLRLEFHLTGDASDAASCGAWFMPPSEPKPPRRE